MLGFNAVQLRANIERVEAIDKGITLLAGINKDAIINAIALVGEEGKNKNISLPEDYKDSNVSSKVVKLIMGLIHAHKYHH